MGYRLTDWAGLPLATCHNGPRAYEVAISHSIVFKEPVLITEPSGDVTRTLLLPSGIWGLADGDPPPNVPRCLTGSVMREEDYGAPTPL